MVLYDAQCWVLVNRRYLIRQDRAIQRMCHERKSFAVVQRPPWPYVPQHVRKVQSDTSPSPPNCDTKGGGRDGAILALCTEKKHRKEPVKVQLSLVFENVWYNSAQNDLRS